MPARTLRVGDDDAAIARWLKRVDDADDTDYRQERDATGKDVTVHYTGITSVFDDAPAGGTRRDLTLTPPGGGKAFEVIGRSAAHTSELQSLMRISYAGLCLKKK